MANNIKEARGGQNSEFRNAYNFCLKSEGYLASSPKERLSKKSSMTVPLSAEESVHRMQIIEALKKNPPPPPPSAPREVILPLKQKVQRKKLSGRVHPWDSPPDIRQGHRNLSSSSFIITEPVSPLRDPSQEFIIEDPYFKAAACLAASYQEKDLKSEENIAGTPPNSSKRLQNNIKKTSIPHNFRNSSSQTDPVSYTNDHLQKISFLEPLSQAEKLRDKKKRSERNVVQVCWDQNLMVGRVHHSDTAFPSFVHSLRNDTSNVEVRLPITPFPEKVYSDTNGYLITRNKNEEEIELFHRIAKKKIGARTHPWDPPSIRNCITLPVPARPRSSETASDVVTVGSDEGAEFAAIKQRS